MRNDIGRVPAVHRVVSHPIPASLSHPGHHFFEVPYSALVTGSNRHEEAFVELLDADLSGTVEWWHRNEPHKPWSIGLILPSGCQYFPDFVVKVNRRKIGGGILLVEIKGDHLLNSEDTLDKVLASHQLYKRPLMLVRDGSGRFMTIRQDAYGKNVEDQIFRVDLMANL